MNDRKQIAFWGSIACANVWFASGVNIAGYVWLAWAAVIFTVDVIREIRK